MNTIRGLSAAFCLVLLAGAAACRKGTNAKEVASVPQDTMLLRDLAEANRNTAQAAVVDNRASDAPGPTTVPLDRSPASGSAPSSGDPCDSPTPVDQRSCLNRSIVANDADLNRTYQELIGQSRKSGGADLEERFRQSQRDWINQRDADCSSQGNGKLWARARARCLADYSAKRTSELQRNLSSLRGQ